MTTRNNSSISSLPRPHRRTSSTLPLKWPIFDCGTTPPSPPCEGGGQGGAVVAAKQPGQAVSLAGIPVALFSAR